MYRAENYGGTPEEWFSILQYAFIFPSNAVLPSTMRDSLEIVAQRTGVGSEASLSITLRTRVEDIERRLGQVKLSYSTDTDDVDLFGWTSQAVASRDDLSAKLSEKEISLNEAARRIESLRKRLDELIVAKEEHETQMLSKFALLLNEKKLRIRTQQRHIAEADRPTKAGASNNTSKASRKRKQDPERPVSDTGDESEAFEAPKFDNMQVDKDTDQSEQARTTSTDTETDVDEEFSPAQRTTVTPDPQSRNAPSATPPPRSLPFGGKSKDTTVQTEKPADISMSNAGEDDGDETASEDDEL